MTRRMMTDTYFDNRSQQDDLVPILINKMREQPLSILGSGSIGSKDSLTVCQLGYWDSGSASSPYTIVTGSGFNVPTGPTCSYVVKKYKPNKQTNKKQTPR
jgi:hypothetical protein